MALPFRYEYHVGINFAIMSYSVLVHWKCALRMALRRPGSLWVGRKELGQWPLFEPHANRR